MDSKITDMLTDEEKQHLLGQKSRAEEKKDSAGVLDTMERLPEDQRLAFYKKNLLPLLIDAEPVERAQGVKKAAKLLNLNMESIYAEVKPAAGEYTEDEKSQADILLELMEDSVQEFFVNEVGDVFAQFAVNGILQVHAVKGIVFKNFLTGLYYESTERGLSSEALRSVINVAEAKPLFTGNKKKTNLRIAKIGDAVIYDLADDNWQSVEFTGAGWAIKPSPPEMIRAANTASQVMPVPGGNIQELRNFLNVKTDKDFLLIAVYTAYCIAAPGQPMPIVCLHGSKGSGKSTNQRVLRRLIDPAAAELTGLPKEESTMALQCDKNYLLCFDNLTKISQEQSNCLCTVSTGGAFSKRRLYTDADEVILRYCRPVTLSGINQVVEKSDILDRCLLIELERIPKTNRTTEKRFWERFEEARPRILGALFIAIAKSMAMPDTELPELERMADFTEMGYKLAVALGFQGEEFLQAIRSNAEDTVTAALKASPVGLAILRLIEELENKEYIGTSAELYKKLHSIACSMRLGRVFPQSTASMTRILRVLTTDLRANGIEVEEDQDKHTKQTTIKMYQKVSPHSPQSSQASIGIGLWCGETSGGKVISLSEVYPHKSLGNSLDEGEL